MVFIIDASLFGDDGEDLRLEFRGRLRTPIVSRGSVPILQKGVLLFGLGQIFCPARERFPIERGARGGVIRFAGGQQVARRPRSEDQA